MFSLTRKHLGNTSTRSQIRELIAGSSGTGSGRDAGDSGTGSGIRDSSGWGAGNSGTGSGIQDSSGWDAGVL